MQAESVGASYLACGAFTDAQRATAFEVFNGLKNPGLQVLYATFGNLEKCVRNFTTTYADRPHTLYLHITNETCRRPPRLCETGREIAPRWRYWQLNEFVKRGGSEFRNYSRRLGRRLRYAVELVEANANENTRVIFSTGLEDNYTAAVFGKILAIYKTELAEHVKITIARNPVGINANRFNINDANFIEMHGARATFDQRECVYSNDGNDIDFGSDRRPLDGFLSVRRAADIFAGHPRCQRYVWWNTQGAGDGAFNYPSRRVIRIYSKDVDRVNKLLLEIENDER